MIHPPTLPPILMPQKSTLNITLAFIGAVVLTSGCSSESEEKRDVYKSRADCIAEWGDAKQCEEVKPGSAHYNLSGRYYGPLYSDSHTSYHALSSFTMPRTVGLSDSEKTRDVYKSKADCIAEWRDANQCELAEAKPGYHTDGYYFGPWHSGSHTSSRALSSFTTPRGGFGSSAAAHLSGS